MIYLAWIALALGFVFGTVGTLVPGLPGSLFIVAGVIIHKMILPEVLSGWTVGIVIVLALLSWLADLLGTVAGAKLGGASKAGLVGAAIGGLIGLAFFPLGLIVGPFLGAVVGELYGQREKLSEIFRSGIGASLGFVISLALRLGLLAVMAIVILIDCIA